MENIFENLRVDIDPTMAGWYSAPVETDVEQGLYLSWQRIIGDYEILIWANGALDEYTLGVSIEHFPTGEILELDSWNDREQIEKILGGQLCLIQSGFEDACMEWLENDDKEGEF